MTRRSFVLAFVTSAALRAGSSPVRVLVVTGGHDYDPSFHSVTEGYPDLRVTVDPHPKAYSRDLRPRYDVILFYDMVNEVPEDQRRNLLDFAEAGKGLVVMHHALCSYDAQDWWLNITGGQYQQKSSSYQHDRDFAVRRVKEHPVTAGLPQQWSMHDETYKGLRYGSGNNVLITTNDPTSDGPLVWISPWQKSRVVSIQPGHNRESHLDGNYRRLVHNAIVWAASGS